MFSGFSVILNELLSLCLKDGHDNETLLKGPHFDSQQLSVLVDSNTVCSKPFC